MSDLCSLHSLIVPVSTQTEMIRLIDFTGLRMLCTCSVQDVPFVTGFSLYFCWRFGRQCAFAAADASNLEWCLTTILNLTIGSYLCYMLNLTLSAYCFALPLLCSYLLDVTNISNETKSRFL